MPTQEVRQRRLAAIRKAIELGHVGGNEDTEWLLEDIERLDAALMARTQALYQVKAALRPLLAAQGTIVPVLNDEYLPAAWVRDIVTSALAADAARVSRAPQVSENEDDPSRVGPLKAGAAPTGSSAEDRTGNAESAERTDPLADALSVVVAEWGVCRACGGENDDDHDSLPHAFEGSTNKQMVALFLDELHGIGLTIQPAPVAALLPASAARQDLCGAERCECGHFNCAHTEMVRGCIQGCSYCECKEFSAAALRGIAAARSGAALTMPIQPSSLTITFTGREVAILACVLSRCEGWDDPRELRRFLNTAADQVAGGFSDAEMQALHEKLAGAWADRCR